MSNRYDCELEVPIEYQEIVAELVSKELGYSYSPSPINISNRVYFCLDEVRYCDLESLHQLTELGIAYDFTSNDGDYYCASRFTNEGEHTSIDLAISGMNPDLSQCRALLDRPADLLDYIQKHVQAVTPLPWDNQVEYGKRYRIKQLLLPGASCAP